MNKALDRFFEQNKNLPPFDFRELINLNNDGIWIIDNDANTVFASEQMAKMLGYTVKEMLGKNLFYFMGESEIKKCKENIKKRKEGIKEKHDFIFLRKNGSLMHSVLSTVPLVNKDGSYFGAIATVSDISPIVNSEKELGHSKTNFKLLLDCTSDWEYFLDLQGNFEYCSLSAEDIVGYKPEIFLGNKDFFKSIIYSEDRERFNEYWRVFFIQGKAIKKKNEFEIRVIHKNGEIKNILHRCQTVFNDKKVFLGYRVSIIDITELKKAQSKNDSDRWRLENIIKGTNVGTWEWNVQTGETIFNEIWANMLGYSLEEISPVSIKTWEKLTHPEDLKRAKELVEGNFRGELLFYNCECRMKHKDGHWVWVQDRGQVFSKTSDGKPLMMFGTHQDISERKKIEQQLREVNDKLIRKNVALNEVINNVELEKESLRYNFKANLEKVILPQIEKMNKKDNFRNNVKVDLLKDSIKDISSSFGVNINNLSNSLTPREVEICNCIKSGLSSKEIAQNLNISLFSLHTHRKNIRKKLELSNSSINLTTYLSNLLKVA